MSRFDIATARNASFDEEIDHKLMDLAQHIDERHFPAIQDYRDLHPGEPDASGHLGPEAVRLSLHLARPRYNLMVQQLRRFKGTRGADISPGFGFLDVLLVERYGLHIVATEHPENIASYGGLLRAHDIEIQPWLLGRDPCPLELESLDFLIFAEVLEHLKLPPLRTLREVTMPIRPDGTLLLTTPNIARQSNINTLQRGENILEQFREDMPPDRDVTDFVSHIREYTVQEVVDLVEAAEFEIADLTMCNWMDVPLHQAPLLNHYTCILATKL